MADYVEKLILDDSQFVSGLDEVIKKTNQAEKEFSELNKEVSESQKQMGKEVTDTSKKIEKANQDTAKSHRAETEELKKKLGQYKIFGVSLDDVKQRLSGYMTSLKGVLASMTSFASLSVSQKKSVVQLSNALGGGRGAFLALAKAANIFKAALVSTGIGAIVVALGSLIAFLTQTQKGMDYMARASAAVGIVFAKLTDYAGYLGEKIFNTFKNPQQALKDFGSLLLDNIINRFEGVLKSVGAVGTAIGRFLVGDFDGAKKAASELSGNLIQVVTGLDETQQQAAKDGIKKFADDISNAVTETDKLTVALQNLEKAKILFIKTEASVQESLEKFRTISKDTSKSYAERTQAAIKANQIEQQLTNERLKLAEEEYRITVEQNALAENTNKDYEKEYQLAAKVSQIKVDSYRIQRRLTEELNGLIKQQEDYLTQATEKVFELGKQWNLVTGSDEFEFVKKQQIEELEKIKNTLQDIAKNRNVDVSAQLNIIDIGISELAKRKFIPEVKKLEREIKPLEIKVRPQVEIGDVNLTAPEIDWSKFMGGIDSFSDLLDSALDEIFGSVTGEKARNFINASGQIIKDFSNIAAEAGRIAVENIDKQLDKIAERREVLESDLDYELQLQSEGLANSAGAKQEEVDKLIAEEERLTKEREKLQREQQRRQLAAETAQQAAALVTSSINIIKGSTNFLGPAGLAVAIPVIASMFAFFAKTKADAFKATRLHTGADRVSDYFGFADRYGDTDLPGRGNGYKVVSSKTGRDTGVIISGREMIVPEKFSIPNQDFFTNLRMGHYDGIDLDSAIRFSQSFKQQNTTSKIVERQVIQPQQKQKQRVLLQVSDKKYTLVTIDESMRDGQIIEIDL